MKLSRPPDARRKRMAERHQSGLLYQVQAEQLGPAWVVVLFEPVRQDEVGERVVGVRDDRLEEGRLPGLGGVR
jgi:hypothetical protein